MTAKKSLGNEYVTKAFQLRERASEREKLTIAGTYYRTVTGELDRAARSLEELVENYPRVQQTMEANPYVILGGVYAKQGRYEEAAKVTRKGLQIVPDHVIRTWGSAMTFWPCSAAMRHDRFFNKPRHETWITPISIFAFMSYRF